MCEPSERELCIKVVLALLLIGNTILQIVGLVKPWGCNLGWNDICEDEGLFNHCWNGTCTSKVRFNGLATLAATSFTLSLVCDVICLTLMWRSYRIYEDIGRALSETFSGWIIWWKWITIFSTLSNTMAGFVLIIGVWQYDRAAAGLYLFSVLGTISSVGISLCAAFYLAYYVSRFDVYFAFD